MDLPAPLSRWIAEASGARAARRAQRVQSLWSGYGELLRVPLDGAAAPSVIVKWVRPPRIGALGAKGSGDVGDARKRRSYEVEASFYETYAARCADGCRVPRLVATRAHDGERVLVLEDLDAAGYGERRRIARSSTLAPCLEWLAIFHATFLGASPDDLWQIGTYWHLATRVEELAAMDDEDLRRAAPALDRKLRDARFQTFVHGDAKLANFCFAPDRGDVAAVDFQYVGGGPGVKDVAYLLDGGDADEGEVERHLALYFRALRAAVEARHPSVDVDALEAEWRALYPIARADYYRFLAGWSKGYWAGFTRAGRLVQHVLRAL